MSDLSVYSYQARELMSIVACLIAQIYCQISIKNQSEYLRSHVTSSMWRRRDLEFMNPLLLSDEILHKGVSVGFCLFKSDSLHIFLNVNVD